MKEKELMKNFTVRSHFWEMHSKASYLEANKRSLSNTYPKIILEFRQLNKEAERLKLYCKLLELEDTFENYKNWTTQKNALDFLSNIQCNVERKQELKRLKLKMKEMK